MNRKKRVSITINIKRLYLPILIASLFFLVPFQSKAFTPLSLIIDDGTFINQSSMSESAIQAFLVQNHSFLATYKVPANKLNIYKCDLSVPRDGIKESTCQAWANNIGPDNNIDSTGWSISHVIYMSANWYGLNPQVILATLQKEQSLITSTAPTQNALIGAMGYGYPDGAGYDNHYAGIALQIDMGAWQLRWSKDHPSANWPVGGTKRVCYTYLSNDCVMTYIANASTSSLYSYTPYYHGNILFKSIFDGWFPDWANAPVSKYVSGTGFWDPAKSKFTVSGSFNNDSLTDLASLYDYGNGKIGIWGFMGGNKVTPQQLYLSNNGFWDMTKTKQVVSGDFNGDKKTDIAAIYDYGSGKIAVWQFISNGATFVPYQTFVSSVGFWDSLKSPYATSGDFNGDGKQELAAIYDYGNGKINIWSFSGAYPSVIYYGKANAWDISKTKAFEGGDVNYDRKADITATYDYGSGRIGLWSFISNGGVLTPKQMYQSSTGFWDSAKSKLAAAGDFNGDGRSDLAAMYDTGEGKITIWGFMSGGTTMTPKVLSIAYNSNCWDADSTLAFESGNVSGDYDMDLLSIYGYGSGKIGVLAFLF